MPKRSGPATTEVSGAGQHSSSWAALRAASPSVRLPGLVRLLPGRDRLPVQPAGGAR